MNVSDISGKHYIDGCWVAGNGDAFMSTNPVNNAVIWHGNNGVQDDTVAAFTAAKAALSTWRML